MLWVESYFGYSGKRGFHVKGFYDKEDEKVLYVCEDDLKDCIFFVWKPEKNKQVPVTKLSRIWRMIKILGYG